MFDNFNVNLHTKNEGFLTYIIPIPEHGQSNAPGPKVSIFVLVWVVSVMVKQ